MHIKLGPGALSGFTKKNLCNKRDKLIKNINTTKVNIRRTLFNVNFAAAFLI